MTAIAYYYKDYNNILFYVNLVFHYITFKLREILSYHLEIGWIHYENGMYHLVYYDSTRKFRMVFPKQKRNIVNVYSPEDDSITFEQIMEYLGPGNNFYGIPTTPKMLGIHKNIIVIYRNGRSIIEKEYSPTDIISLS